MADNKTLNLDEKVSVKNIANWKVGFARIESIGDVTIQPNATMRLPRSEIIAQINSGNTLFTGIDGKGSHATLFIDDQPTRIEVDFDSEDGKSVQHCFSDDIVKRLFAFNQVRFEDELPSYIRTRAEKYAIVDAIKRLHLNDYSKIRYIEKYTGYNVQ
jgi:hypothetical protein